jgi:arginyl-tRNA synthetase
VKDRIGAALVGYFQEHHADQDWAFAGGGLGPAKLPLTPPRDSSHGDLSSNAAMVLSKLVGRPPRELAVDLAAWCEGQVPGLVAEVAGPGFINFRLPADQHQALVATILAAGADYGRSEIGAGRKINLEYVSANPTGPPVVVSARAAAIGSTLARLFKAAGYSVVSEYYFNDAGAQITALGASLRARWRELRGEALELPENGYHGSYLVDMARGLDEKRSEDASAWNAMTEEESLDHFAEYAVLELKDEIAAEMERFRSPFDVWFREASLHEEGKVDEVLALFEKKDLVYEEGGARWFRSTKFGDEKDRVVVRSDGRPTYYLNDAAYHLDKLQRGFDNVVNILGPDHHAHVTKMQAIASAIDAPEGWLEIVLLQWVTLVEDGEAVAMSKRAGEFVTMKDLVDEVGVDVARSYFLTRRCNSHLEFDLTLAREQSSKSPVFYAQYAMARIAGVLRKAGEAGHGDAAEPALERLSAKEELELIKVLEQLPATVISAGAAREPNRLFNYLSEVATAFHKFYHECKVVSEDADLSEARLALCRATRQVLLNGLTLIGVAAPERM